MSPVLRDGTVVGYVTAGAYGYATDTAIGLCLISGADKQTLSNGEYTVMIEGQAYACDVSLTPFYDPKSKRMLT